MRTRSLVLAVALFPLGPAAADDSQPAKPAPAAADARMEAWWADLEKGEEPACQALLQLADRPGESVAFLKAKLKPLVLDADHLQVLIVRLGNKKDEVWKPAFEELEYFDPRLARDLPFLMGDVTEPPARQRLVEVLSGRKAGSMEGKPIELRAVGGTYNFYSRGVGSWWAEHQVSKLSSSDWGNPKKKWTRAVRALVLLEHVGTPEAVAVLKVMAGGHPEAFPTRFAKEALGRVPGVGKPEVRKKG